MSRFESFVMVDWSAANDTGPRPRKDAIWASAVLGGVEREPAYLRNREVAVDWLDAVIGVELAAGRRVMVGFDFPFGYPAGFAAAITGSADPLKLWAYYADHLEDTPRRNNRFALAGALNARLPGVGPFWFNGTATDVPHLPRKGRERTPDHGQKERRGAEERARGTFSCWQMGGAGAVGGQVMTGMAALERLRRRHPGQIAVWPFGGGHAPVHFVEVWPSLIADEVRAQGDPIRDRAQVRLLARALSRLPEDRLARMMRVSEPEEGWILGLGHEDELASAACPN